MTFDPASITGLRCIEADRIVGKSDGDSVTSLTDYGTNGYTGSGSATYRASVAAFSNKPALEFNGTSDGFVFSSDAGSWTGGFVLAVFVDGGSAGAYERIWDKNYSSGGWLGRNNTTANSWGGAMPDDAGATKSTFITLTDGTAHIVAVNSYGSGFGVLGEGWKNQNAGVTISLSSDTTAVRIGRSAGGDYLSGKIAAIFWINRTITIAEYDNLVGYLGAKYGIQSAAISEPATKYMVSFNGSTETLRVLTSYDAATFYEIPCTYAPTSGYCRDPNVRITDKFRMLHTDGTFGALSKWAIAESTDGITYTTTQEVELSSVISGVNRVWAPKWVVDSDGVEHVVYCASTDGGTSFKFYEQHPSVAGVYTAWSAPVEITGTSFPTAKIDPFILTPRQIGGSTYELWFRDFTGGADYIRVFTSASLLSGYASDATRSGNWLGAGSGVLEAPVLLSRGGANWRLYADRFAAGTGLFYYDSSDNRATFGSPTGITAPSPVTRHGCVIANISDAVATTGGRGMGSKYGHTLLRP